MNGIIEISIREIRVKRGLSISELAKKAGISKSIISKIERKEVVPSLITLCKISKALGVDLGDLINT